MDTIPSGGICLSVFLVLSEGTDNNVLKKSTQHTTTGATLEPLTKSVLSALAADEYFHQDI